MLPAPRTGGGQEGSSQAWLGIVWPASLPETHREGWFLEREMTYYLENPKLVGWILETTEISFVVTIDYAELLVFGTLTVFLIVLSETGTVTSIGEATRAQRE